MFEGLQMAPPDAILGLSEAFRKDANPNKVNLAVGVFKDAQGNTPTLECVKEAERRMLENGAAKSYLPIDGSPRYGALVQALMFGADHEILQNRRAATSQTPGGTGALRVAGDFIHRELPGATIWVSDPTWVNHIAVFKAAGVEIKRYPYYDAEKGCLDFEATTAALRQIPAGDVVLLHGCCHNPSGMDPDAAQWAELEQIRRECGWLPLFDFAYQGFGDGLEEDAAGLRSFLKSGCEMLIASSFSKNFGLYNERVGAMTVVGADHESAAKAQSHVKACIRANYSNPPFHGAGIVTTVLDDAGLKAQWAGDVKAMRERINGMRHLFVDTMKAKGVAHDYSFIIKQKGMFSFSGLSREQVQTLREKHSIYIVGSGRINVAGLTDQNMDFICGAIASVL